MRGRRRRLHGRGQWGQRWKHSLRLRLTAMFVALAVLMVVIFVGGIQRGVANGWRDMVRPLLADYVDRLVIELGSPPDVARAQALVARLPISIRIDGPQIHFDSHPERRDDKYGLRSNLREGVLTRVTADGSRISFGLGSLPWQREPQRLAWLTLIAMLLLIVLAYSYVRQQLRPLADLRAGAERFGQGRFDVPIPYRCDDELGDVAARMNTMAHEIERMLEAKRALLLAVSHELRSPLTRARLNAELLPETPAGATERAALLRDLAEMRDLIAGLLESERLSGTHSALQREPVDLVALVREVAAGHGDAARVTLDLPADQPALPLDRARMRVLLRNLLDNALRHGGEAAQPPSITLRGEGDGIRLSVRDHGPGVDEAQLAHLTEAFYRTDSARARATGGVGLGLYLCRLIAQAHGGELTVRNASPGLAIEVLLPVRAGA